MDVATDNAQAKEEDKILQNKNGTRYKKRYMKRQWEDTTRDDSETNEKRQCDKGERIKRKKTAMLLGYCGVDYYGMQRNPGVRTIEEDLLKALFEAKYITEEDFKNQQNAQFQRSSRTDKGVSAARQVVSLKLPLETNIEEINKRLPECIKVFGVKRVTNRFNSKLQCNARTYSYTLPTYVFEPSLVAEDERKNYRISAERIGQINEILGFYKGAKSYHNFTEKKHHTDPSALRFMMCFNLDKVFVEYDMEFAVLLVKGQSFMLHQIRKMVGLAIAVMRGLAPPSMMERAFAKDKVIMPTAPGLGLVLDKVHYDRYDTKFKSSHDSLVWDAEEPAVEKFKHEFIYPNIVKGEIAEKSMALWLEKLSGHSFDPSDDTTQDKTEDEEREIDSDDEGNNLNDDEKDAGGNDAKIVDVDDKPSVENSTLTDDKSSIEHNAVTDDKSSIENKDSNEDVDKRRVENKDAM